MTDATPVPAAEGAPAEEAEKEMEAALPAGEGASLEEPKIETETAEVLDGDRCQPEETEAAAPQVSAWCVEVLGRCACWDALSTG